MKQLHLYSVLLALFLLSACRKDNTIHIRSLKELAYDATQNGHSVKLLPGV